MSHLADLVVSWFLELLDDPDLPLDFVSDRSGRVPVACWLPAAAQSSNGLDQAMPYYLVLLGGILFGSAFDTYRRNRNRGAALPENQERSNALTGPERVVFKAVGIPLTAIGLMVLAMTGCLGWEQWTRVALWPRASAVLVRKDVSRSGARLVFRYEVMGRPVTGAGFRWGSEKAMRDDLASYLPGTEHTISYDPANPRHAEIIQSGTGELPRVLLALAACGVLFTVAGVVVYRWSYGHPGFLRRRD
jgi:hypothetical protein